MKKISLFLFILFTVVLAGCGQSNQTITTSSLPTGTTTTNTSNIGIEAIAAIFDTSKIEFIIDDAAMESYYVYKNIKTYGSGYIGVQIGGNDGVTADLLYIENNKIVKRLNDVFWYNYYVDHKIHEFCGNALDTCPTVKETSCTIDNNKNQTCAYSFFEYMFNLINGKEVNSYFTQKLQIFETSL